MNQQVNTHASTREWTARFHDRHRSANGRSVREAGPASGDRGSATVVIADPQPAIRRGVRSVLERSGGIAVVGEAAVAGEVLAETCRHRPDVLVMDLRLGGNSGIEVIRQVCRATPRTGVLVFSDVGEDTMITGALHAGARGYLTKDAGPDEILRGVQAVAAGQAIICRTVAARFAAWISPRAAEVPYPFSTLTAREREVLERLAAGKPNAAIARELSLAPKTISNRVSAIFAKLGTANRAEVIVLARDAGLG